MIADDQSFASVKSGPEFTEMLMVPHDNVTQMVDLVALLDPRIPIFSEDVMHVADGLKSRADQVTVIATEV